MRYFFFAIILTLCAAAGAQDAQRTLPQMPRYDRFEKLDKAYASLIDRGIQDVSWDDDGQSFYYSHLGKWFKYNVATLTATEQTSGPKQKAGPARQAPRRGRQFTEVFSADGKLKAFYQNNNVYLSKANGKDDHAITTGGNSVSRVKFGSANWTYGEELDQREAMWFSPDSHFLAYYRFDESDIKDYYVAYDQLKVHDTLNAEPYMKAGDPNPLVDLYVYSLKDHHAVKLDTKFQDPSLAEYVYGVRWAPNGKELLFNRMNRKENVMEFCAGDPSTGQCRVIFREERNDGWVDQSPNITMLKDNHRFILRSDRTGFHNLYLYDLNGKLLQTLTHDDFEIDRVVAVDEAAGEVYYTSRDGNTPYLAQLHRVKLDGTDDTRLTDPALSHTVFVAPTGGKYVDIAETTDTPPVTSLCDGAGKSVAVLSTADTTAFEQLGLKKSTRFTFTAADGKTTCYGTLMYPSDFDPAQKYPLLVFVYGGPESGGGPERFTVPPAVTELGFLVATFDGRQTAGRGRAFLTAAYRQLGITEIDDEAAGVQQLEKQNTFIDPQRVGIQGTSYGGYFSAMSILRFPDVYQVACASSPVTDWRNYDSIYTERYMGLPTAADNLTGYNAGSCMTYAKNLKGWLMLYYGTADNNVHPSNTIQLANKLEELNKRYDMQVGGDKGHSQMNTFRMWEYFVNHLILEHPSYSAMDDMWKSRGLTDRLRIAQIFAKKFKPATPPKKKS